MGEYSRNALRGVGYSRPYCLLICDFQNDVSRGSLWITEGDTTVMRWDYTRRKYFHRYLVTVLQRPFRCSF